MMKVAVVTALTLLLSSTALAGRFDPDPEISDGRIRASVVVGHSVSTGVLGETKSIVAAPQLTVDYRLLKNMVAHVDVPTTHISVSYDTDGGDSTFELANVQFGASFIGRMSDTMVLRIGGALAVPTATAEGSATTAKAARIGTASSHSLWNLWQQLADTLTVISTNSLSIRTGYFRAVAHLDVGFVIPTADDELAPNVFRPTQFYTADKFGVLAQLQLDVGYRSKIIETGLSLRGVVALVETSDSGTDNDRFQGSIAPFFKAFISGGFLDVRFNLNLDAPAGFSFDDERWWGLEIGLGVFL